MIASARHPLQLSPRQANKRNAENTTSPSDLSSSSSKAKRLRFGATACGLEAGFSEMNFDGSSPENSDAENKFQQQFAFEKNSSSRKRPSESSLPYPQQHKSYGDFKVVSPQQKTVTQVPDDHRVTTMPAAPQPPPQCHSSYSSPLRSKFENKYNYIRKLKQLPSQLAKINSTNSFSASTSATSISSQMSSSSTAASGVMASPSSGTLSSSSSLTKKIHVDDALRIFEEMLAEREEQLKMEFKAELEQKLGEQYDQFAKYNEEFIRNQISQSSCSYLS